jgi:hypothetical protein
VGDRVDVALASRMLTALLGVQPRLPNMAQTDRQWPGRATAHDMADRVMEVGLIRAVLGRMRLAGRVGGWRRGRPRAACRAPASCPAGLGRR